MAQGVGIHEGLHLHPSGSASGWVKGGYSSGNKQLPSYQAHSEKGNLVHVIHRVGRCTRLPAAPRGERVLARHHPVNARVVHIAIGVHNGLALVGVAGARLLLVARPAHLEGQWRRAAERRKAKD